MLRAAPLLCLPLIYSASHTSPHVPSSRDPVYSPQPSETTQQRCAFVTFEHHVSALAATKMGGVHRMNANDRPIVVRFADTQGQKRPRNNY